MYRFFILSALFFLLSCDDNDPSPSFQYPLESGKQWEYVRVLQATNFRPDSLAGDFEQPDTQIIQVQVKEPQVLKDSQEAYPLLATLSDQNDNRIFSLEFYRQDESGLYQVAYRPVGYIPVFPKRKGISFKYKGRVYGSLAELSQTLPAGETALLFLRSDSLIYNTPPRPALKYPMAIGSRWIFTDEEFRIEKQITDYGTINTAAGDFEAYTVQWLYYFDNSDKPDEDIALSDFISEQGLLKRRLSVFNVVLTTETGEDAGYFDFYDTIEITAIQTTK